MPQLTWTDVQMLAEMLYDAQPELDPRYIRFTDLHAWVMALDGFSGAPDASNEKILEAIQMAWIAEWED